MSSSLNLSNARRIGILLFLGFLVFTSIQIGSGANSSPTCANNVPSLLQCGITPVTFTNNLTGAVTITFPISFATPPNITLVNYSNPFLGSGVRTSDTIPIVGGGATPQTWVAMPLMITEIFGNTNNRIREDDRFADQMRLTVNVVVAGTGTSTLEVQLSPDGVNWVDPAATPGSCNVGIGVIGLQFSLCSLTAGITGADPFVRIVGFFGNGIISPQFGIISVSFLSTFGRVSDFEALFITNTNFVLRGNLVVVSTATFTIGWEARE